MSITISKGLGSKNGVRLSFVRSPNIGGALTPEYIVIHDTASGLKDDGDVSWLTNPASKVSAHVVVSREGKITQLVPFTIRAWHAGESTWAGRRLLNGYAIGIEIDNPGKMSKVSEGVYKSAVVTIDTNKNPSLKVSYAKTTPHGAGYWLAYSDAQIAAVEELCLALCGAYRIKDIVTHWMISPGRKIDTNPLYPLDALRAATLSYKPMGFMGHADTEANLTGTDESAEPADEVAVEPTVTVKDESAGGGESKLKTFFKSKIAWAGGLIGGVGFSDITGFLTDWRVVCAIAAFILIGYGLYVWSEKK